MTSAGSIIASDGAINFSLPTQPRSTDPPIFILTFTVNIAPPTNIACQVGSSPVELSFLSREVSQSLYNASLGAVPSIDVSVTLTTRRAGEYRCIISIVTENGFDAGSTNISKNQLPAVSTRPISISGRYPNQRMDKYLIISVILVYTCGICL